MIDGEDAARAFIMDRWGLRAHDRCQRLIEALRLENERQNLVSRSSLPESWVRHVADSAQLLLYAPPGVATWVDIGTGAGFPGLVVALLQPDLAVTLVEPRARRVAWLNAMVQELGLTRCRVAAARAENLPGERYDILSARAVAPLNELLPMTSHLLPGGSSAFFLKGRRAEDELAALPATMRKRYVFHVKHSLTAADGRIMVVQAR